LDGRTENKKWLPKGNGAFFFVKNDADESTKLIVFVE
jgi:hypothetical protein